MGFDLAYAFARAIEQQPAPVAQPAVTFSHALGSWLVRAADGWWAVCDPQTARDAVDCGYAVLDAI